MFWLMHVIGYVFTIYGTLFAAQAATNAFYLFPGQPFVALACLVLGFAFPAFGHYLSTEPGAPHGWRVAETDHD